MGKHGWTPPQPNDGVEGYLYAHRAIKASRQFLRANPEAGRSLPRFNQVMAATDHIYKYPGDLPLFEGTKGDEGTGKRGK
jgi:hypothetical protein